MYIIIIQPNNILLSSEPQWWLYYKNDDEIYFHKISVSYSQLKYLLEKYGYETNNIFEFNKLGINTHYINSNLLL